MTTDAATDLVSLAPGTRRGAVKSPVPRRRLVDLYYGSSLYQALLGLGRRHVVRTVPQEPWSGRLSAANALFQGRFSFAGQLVQTPGRSPWDVAAPSPRWFAELHGFGWLRDFRAANGLTARQHARDLVRGWIAGYRRYHAAAWAEELLARRILSWLFAYDFLLFEADEPFQRLFRDSLHEQTHHLARIAGLRGVALDVAIALMIAGETIGLPRWARRGRSLVDAVVARQVLADGGHRSRNPLDLHRTLRSLLTLRWSLVSLKSTVPETVARMIEPMAATLRMLRHADGGLAAFHGGDEGDPTQIDETLRGEDTRGRLVVSAPESGFERLASGRTSLICDSRTGGDFASALAFEMSVGRDRLIVSCGSYPDADAAWHAAARTTAAHSALVVDDRNAESAPPLDDPRLTETLRGEEGSSVWLELGHAGYVRRFGLIQRRRLHLTRDGHELVGEDSLRRPLSLPRQFGRAASATTAAIRFHLHPAVSASLVRHGKEVLMRLPSGAGWMFEAASGAIALEESIYLGRRGDARRTQQIVLTLPIGEHGLDITWRFARVED
ncbi:MAG: hypothetical protein EXQ85_01635 [Alphaproteobacteria bacterium]|nr:hypothetical protein [Alphaproteobacteria bacterium]